MVAHQKGDVPRKMLGGGRYHHFQESHGRRPSSDASPAHRWMHLEEWRRACRAADSAQNPSVCRITYLSPTWGWPSLCPFPPGHRAGRHLLASLVVGWKHVLNYHCHRDMWRFRSWLPNPPA